jgi:predicted  nucleic acid-binding Zn-ribbon protein
MAKNDAYIAYILKELRGGVAKRDKILSKFVKQWQTSERTFDRAWKIAQETYRIESDKAEKEIASIVVSEKVESVRNGLKSKNERMDNIQKQIDELNSILESGKTKDAIIDEKTLSYLDIERSLTAIEKATLMKTIKDLNAELNKMDGSYAPTQTKIELSKEQPLFPDVQTNNLNQ